MKKLLSIVLLLLSWTTSGAVSFSSVNDGRKPATQVIQKAIDLCAKKGGGEVVLPAGTYLCSTIVLRSHVSLILQRGATIKGDTDYRNAYRDHIDTGSDGRTSEGARDIVNDRALILGKGIEDAGIYGPGTIDGQSNLLDFAKEGFGNNDFIRPYGVLFNNCRNICVKDVKICNAGFWTVRFYHCEKVRVDGVTIRSLSFINNDGIDVDARDVVISNCTVDSDDDAICLKSDDPSFVTENVVVTNCLLSSNCNAIKLGTASRAGFRNIRVNNCVIRPAPESNRRDIWKTYRNIEPGTIAGLAGIAIECADGGTVERVDVSDITMSGVTTPIFICLNRRKGTGIMRHITVSNVNARAEGVLPCMVVGIPERKIENVRLSNINVVQTGGDKNMVKPLRESVKAYPENRMFGHWNPACGLFLRHVDGISVENFKVKLLRQDERPCVVQDDVDGSIFNNVQCEGTSGPLFKNQ